MHFISNDEVLIGLNKKELKLLSNILAHVGIDKKLQLSVKDEEILGELRSLFMSVEVPTECGCHDCENFSSYD